MDSLLEELAKDIKECKTIQDIDLVKSKYLGKKSILKREYDKMKTLSSEERQEYGKQLNEVKKEIETDIAIAKKNIEIQTIEDKLHSEYLDMSLPGYAQQLGGLHPLSILENKCNYRLKQLGFSVVEGPEVEDEYHNFDALNIPKHHPARDAQDTFWVDGGLLLRSHTTTVQTRVLEAQRDGKLPIKIISPGRVYRNEALDATHLACFHQYEGLWVGENVKLSHLKGTLEYLLKAIYGNERKIRFKPKFYPYTEPSLGADVSCKSCNGAGCPACRGAGWVTVVGAGMVHPKVFKELGFDPEKVSGFAFGFGLSRMASQLYNVKMRDLYGMNLQVFKNIKGKE